MNITYDWRYINTLRLNFDIPIGIASNDELDPNELIIFKSKFGDIDPEDFLDNINYFIIYCFKLIDIEIDWRDSTELELHLEASKVEPEYFVDRLKIFIGEYYV